MQKIAKSLSALFFCIFPSLTFAHNNSLNIWDIYHHLLTVGGGIYQRYDGITYAMPSLTSLTNNNWIIETPNIWGKNISKYNQGFTPSSGNQLDKEFLVPTCHLNTDCHGYSSCMQPGYTTDEYGNKRKLCVTSAYIILDHIYNAIANAKHSVDIVTLQPTNFTESSFSTGAFTATIRHAIKTLAMKSTQYSHPVKIRFLQGIFLPYTAKPPKNNLAKQSSNEITLSQKKYLKKLTKTLPKTNKLIITVGSIRSCEFKKNCGNEDKQHDIEFGFAFNHGKIIDVDNSTLITGGHNLLGEDYLQKNPINDLSFELHGSIANNATTYANTLWKYVCNNRGIIANIYSTYKNGKIIDNLCQTSIDSSSINQTNIPLNTNIAEIMPISKLNNGVGLGNDADQSEVARVFAFQHAQNNIKISQQALFYRGFNNIFKRPILHPLYTIDGTVMQALAQAILNNVNVYIISSNLKAGNYTSNVDISYVYQYLLNLLQKKGIDLKLAQTKLKQNLHLATISYYKGQGNTTGSHNKFWMVDDKIFYIGSHNIYPSSLQQFGIIIDSSIAAKELKDKFWNPMWKNAKYFLF